MMMQEESRLLYPPVGSTFDGHASRGVLAARSRGIDTLADLQYRRPQPLQYGDMLQGGCRTPSSLHVRIYRGCQGEGGA